MSLGAVIFLPIVIVHYGFSLSKDHDRSIETYKLSKSIKEKIRNDTDGMDYKEIIQYSMERTKEQLAFAKNNDIPRGKANCIGYAQMGASICNYAMASNGMGYRAKPVVGYVNLFGINLCAIATKIAPIGLANFVKDHDFVEISVEGKTIYFGPCLYDFLIDCTTSVTK